ncbi:MAG: protein kinase [Chloroherpetonaceae bacterium]|nr:protein kinase [Chthonomonadaceae bacterium]MDW8208593.1 protein kinase [Chloroherpetonaceae bacterium]
MINRVIQQRYEVFEKLGESPLFAVYKARDKASDRVVTLKAVQSHFAADIGFVQGLTEGMAAAANLNHPQIARFHEQGTEEGVPYLIVEFVRGINLKERIRRIAPFTLSVAIDFACAIGEALHFAHALGQPHGDLRPQNVVISPEGVLKVTDFGCAQGIARSARAQEALLMRTAPYRAPELSPARPGSVAGDIYALGAILYEMLTGAPPYVADTPDALADQHASATIPSPRAINPGVPRAVEGIVAKCLQKRPEQRYRTAAELLNDLKAVRDALRFGRPLSWVPEIPEAPAEAPRVPAETSVAISGTAPSDVLPGPMTATVGRAQEREEAMSMPGSNSLREQEERVSIYIRASIVAVTVVILVCLIGLVGVWSSMWVVPKPVAAPEFVGKPIEETRRMAESLNVRLREHAEYSEKPRGVVYRTDLERNARIRPGQIINVWYSKGPAYVDVPKVVGLTRDEAEKRLLESGLTIGPVTVVNSETVPPNVVVKQTVSYKKRVLHDTPVGLVISDGPKLEYAPPVEAASGGAAGTEFGPDESSGMTEDPAVKSADQMEPRAFRRTITIPMDGLGLRQVRVEYRDAQGRHPPVIDEPHEEGDRIPVSFDYVGKNITLEVYYDDRKVFERTFDPQATRRQAIR